MSSQAESRRRDAETVTATLALTLAPLSFVLLMIALRADASFEVLLRPAPVTYSLPRTFATETPMVRNCLMPSCEFGTDSKRSPRFFSLFDFITQESSFDKYDDVLAIPAIPNVRCGNFVALAKRKPNWRAALNGESTHSPSVSCLRCGLLGGFLDRRHDLLEVLFAHSAKKDWIDLCREVHSLKSERVDSFNFVGSCRIRVNKMTQMSRA